MIGEGRESRKRDGERWLEMVVGWRKAPERFSWFFQTLN